MHWEIEVIIRVEEVEIDYIIEKVPEIIKKLSDISPFRKAIEKLRAKCDNPTEIPQTV